MFEHEKQVVQRYLDAVGGGEADIWKAVEGNWHEDASWTLIGRRRARGRSERTRINQARLLRARPQRRQTTRNPYRASALNTQSPSPSTRLWQWRTAGSSCSAGRTLAGRNGLEYKNEYCWIFAVRDDKIESLYEFCGHRCDRGSSLRQDARTKGNDNPRVRVLIQPRVVPALATHRRPLRWPDAGVVDLCSEKLRPQAC